MLEVHVFTDDVSGQPCELVAGETGAGVRHPDCGYLAVLAVELDAFYCTKCGWNGRISGAWAADLIGAGRSAGFRPPAGRIQVSYCTEFCGDACTCRLAGSHVIYCRGCGKAWLEPPETRPLADPPVDQPSSCACTCADGDAHYEDWVVDPWVCCCGVIAPKGEFRVFPHDDCDGGRPLTLEELQRRSRG